mgnify:CR=1 FL=1
MSRPPRNPLIPMRHGVSPSCVALPQPAAGATAWASVLDFLAWRLPAQSRAAWAARMAAGEVLDDGLLIACGEGAVRLVTVQREGKGAMDAASLLRGFPVPKGEALG